jgi:hypothetical protein
MAADEVGAPDDAAPYGAIPARAFADRKLGESDFRVIGMIARYDQRSLPRGKGAGCFKSINRLATEIGMNPRQFRRSVENGVRHGYIERTPRGERWDGYVLRIIYRGEDSTVTPPLTGQSSPPVSTVTGDRTAESSGCGLTGAHIRESLSDDLKGSGRDISLSDGREQQSGQDDLVDLIVKHWRNVAVPAGAVAIRKVSQDRRKLILQSIETDSVAEILAAVDRISQARWATGRGAKDWRVDIEWLLKAGNVNSVLEGKYDDRETGDGFTRALKRNLRAFNAADNEYADFFGDAADPEPEPHSDIVEADYTIIGEGSA